MKNFIKISAVIMFLSMFAFITSVKAQMSGTYTVGTTGTYTSLTAAYNALVSGGVNGPVILSVISDLSGQQTLSGTVTGASTTNTITITSSTGNPTSYTIGTTSNYALYFQNGVSNVIVKNITIGVASYSNQYAGVYFTQSTTPYTNIEFRGCNINSYSLAPNNTTYASVYYSGASNSSYYFNNLRFIRNNINGGYNNFYFNYLSGAATNMASRVGVTIDSNVLTDAGNAGIYSQNYAYYPSISYNTITSRSSSATYYGIYTSSYTTIDSMIGNKITITSSSQAFGLYLSNYQNYNTTYGANAPMFIANNEIRIMSSASTSYGIYAYGTSSYCRFDIINNSIYMNGTSSCYGVQWYPSNNATYKSTFINNNMHINTSGTVYMFNFAGGTSYWGTTYSTVNYNNYYRTGTGTTYYGTNTYTTFAAFKAATSGQEVNSTNLPITYIDSTKNLELSSYTGFTCPQVAGVLKDIRNNTRGTTTYKGCYEPFILDAGIVKNASTPTSATKNQLLSLSASLKNFGLTTLTTATISWAFKDTVRTPPVSWAGSLSSGSTANISLGSAFITSGNTNPVKLWVSNPNSSTDPNAENDTINFTIYGCDSALKGTYTIGGTGADFATINDALMPLMNCGIGAPVTFLMNSGTYNEAVLISGAILGSSTINTVTFTSAANHVDSVLVYVSGTTCTLSETANLRFENITIGTQSSSGEIAVVLDGNCSNIEFYQCNLNAYTSATAETYFPVYYSNITVGNCLTDIKFIKNNITGGYANIHLFTGTTVGVTNMGSVTIDSNILTEGFRGGIIRGTTSTRAYYMYFPSISYNTIIGRAVGSSYQYGICLGSTYQPPASNYDSYYDVVDQIVGNKIKIQIPNSYGCGIQLPRYLNRYSSAGVDNAGTQCLIANNEIIHALTSGYSYGIYGANYPKADIINNSIYLKSTTTTNPVYGLFIANQSTTYGPMTIKNNNIVVVADNNPDNAASAYFNDGAAYVTSAYKIMDYNNYYSSNGVIGYVGGPIYDLATWRTMTGQDAGSTVQFPSYTDFPNDLSVYGFGLACPRVASVLTDIDNTTRPTNTIMGAYEFISCVDYDIQPFALETPFSVVSNGIDELVSIRLLNHGTDTVTSATINWKFNNVVQDSVNWTGILASGNSVVIPMDTITPIGGTNTLEFITSLPNGQIDTMRFNDTLFVNLFGCDSMLNGNYTIGIGGDFASADDAVGALYNCGINGAVTMAFLTGTYPPLSLSGSINGASEINTITFTSMAGDADSVTIGTSTTASNALTLDKVSHLIFKDITIGLSTSLTTNGVELKGMCENVLFDGCIIRTYSNGNSNTYCGVKYDNVQGNNHLKNVRFIKNQIDGGYSNMYFYYSAGNNTNMVTGGISIIIDSNMMTNAYNSGIYNYYYSKYSSISFNTITSRASATATYYGIYSQYFTTIDSLIGNKILITSTGTCYGMYFFQYHNNNSASYGAAGPMFIANNEVIVLGGANAAYGFYDNSGSGLSRFDLLHNSFYVSGTGTKYGAYLYPYNTSYKYTFSNNNVYVSTTGRGDMIYFGTATYNTTVYSTVDYNNYYKPSGTAYYGNSYTSLAAWQTGRSQDINSTNTDPGFSATPTNLIPANFSTCPILTEVSTDIDGQLRIGVNYKGCYTAVFNSDAGISEFVGVGPKISAGSNDIYVRIMNYGTDTLKSVDVQCSVNGVSQVAVQLTGLSLLQYQDTVVLVGTCVATVGTTHALKAWTYDPNGITDQNIANDTILHTTIGCAQVLNGTYDIGGGNNDFATLNDAMITLTNCGVSGPVVLRLATGNYTTLNSFSTVYEGTNATNTVTFTSLSGNPSDVVIGAASAAATTFNGAKYLRFEKLTIGNTSTTYGVYFQNTNENIDFYRCIINSNPTATSTTTAGVYYTNASGHSNYLKNINFIKDTIKGGYSNMYFNYPTGNTTNMMLMSVTIDSNVMQDAYYYGVYSNYNAYYPSISYNTITSRASGSVTSTWYGMYFNYYNSVEKIEGNKISSSNTSISTPYGIYIYYYFNYNGYGTSNTTPLIANNEIILYSASSNAGIRIYNPNSNLQLLHNSVYMYGTGGGHGLYLYNTSTVNLPIIKHNIFATAASSAAYPIYYNGNYFNANYYMVDYNNYYSTGSNVAYAASSAITDLTGLQMVTGQDSNSINVDPGFLSPTINLHTVGNSMFAPRLNNVLEDLVGKQRKSVTNMGCYHDFTPLALDVKLESIVSPAGSLTANTYTPINVAITNFGSDDLDSVNIYWSVNGDTVHVYPWTNGPLEIFKTSSTITIGGFVPQSGINTLVVYVAQPNGGVDLNTSNDTLSFTAYACDSILTAGTYTVGPNGNFTNESQLEELLNHCGISGPVVIEFTAGTYGSLNFTSIPGSSSTNTVTFTSATGDSSDVVFASTGSALTLQNVSHVIFNKVTFDVMSGNIGVELIGYSENVEISNCHIRVRAAANATYRGISRENIGDPISNIRILNNRIDGGYYGIYLYGASSSARNTDIVINNNSINSIVYGTYAYYTNTNQINDNIITQHTSSTSAYYGMYFSGCYAKEIVRNRIKIDYNSNHGIYGDNFGAASASSRLLIANNEMILTNRSTGRGVYIGSGQNYTDFYHNSILMQGTGQANACLYLLNSATSFNVYNNIFINISGNSASSATYAFGSTNQGYVTNFTMDYNNYYTLGTNLMYTGSGISDLFAWQIVTAGKDMNSTSMLPSFVDPTFSSLHTDGFSMFCTPLAEVPNDMLDSSRTTSITNMGCYHDLYPLTVDAKLESIDSPTSDMAVGHSTPISVKLTNFGLTALDSVNIYWSVNGGQPQVYNWIGGPLSLFSTTSTISLGNFVPQPGFNTIVVYLAQPNGVADMNTSNDMLSITAYACDSVLNGTYTVGVGADFSDESEVIAVLTNCGINGPVVFEFLSGTYGNLSFASIPGGNTTNTVTFTSATGDAESVVFMGTSTGDALFLNTASNMVFDRVTLDASSNTNGCGVKFMGFNSNILFTGCNIKADASTTSNSSAAVYYKNTNSATIYLQNVKFIKNNIDGGYDNFYFNYACGNNTPMGNKTASIIIDSNVLSNAYRSGIYSDYMARYPSISYNTITSRNNTPTTYYGIFTNYYNTIDSMIGNKISITGASSCYGMRFAYYQNYNTSYGADAPVFIANNEIIVNAGGSTSYGFYENRTSQHSRFDIYHNSIYVSGGGTLYGVYLSPYNDANYRINFLNNNVYVNTTGAGYLINIVTIANAAATYCTIDYNNYYKPSGTTYFGSTAYTTLAAWKSAYSQDAHSVTLSPSYLNVNNSLELIGVGNSGLTCPRLAYVSTDLRKGPRSNPTYMGCYEPFALDAAIDTAGNIPFLATAHQKLPLSLVLKNVGLDTINNAIIEYTYNNVPQMSKFWNNPLASGDSTSLALDSILIAPGSNYVKAWISNLNGVNDQNPINDTILFNIFACDTALNGIYTVGGPGADFENITEAMLPVTYCGVNGPVTFVVNSGIYNEAINLTGAISGLTPTNTITFVSAANHPDSVQIYMSGTTVLLSSVSNIRFHDITLGSTVDGGRTVVFEGSCSDIDFYGCNIYSSITGTSNASCGVYYSQADGVTTYLSDVRFVKNTLTGGYANFYFYYACGNSNDMSSSSIIIDSNIMTEAYTYGIYVYRYTYMPSISYNTITTRSAGTTQYGIYFYYYITVNDVIGNKIKLLTTTSGYGMYIYQYTNQYVNTNPAKVYNNEIIIPYGSGTVYGMHTNYSKVASYHNTIYLGGSGTNYGFNIGQTATSQVFDAKNNMIACLTSDVNRGYPIYTGSANYVLSSNGCYLDYNNYYSVGNYLASIAGNNVTSLADLRANTGQDANSVNVKPHFYDYPNSTKVYGYDMVGPQFSDILTDINGNSRASTTTMGAHEFVPSLNLDILPQAMLTPLSVVGQGVETVSITLKNIGIDTIYSALINWEFNNISQSQYGWTGMLLSGASTQITLGTIMPAPGINTFRFISSLPNYQPDAYVSNDTLMTSIYACDTALRGIYTIGGPSADFATISDALFPVINCGISGPVTFSIDSGQYTESIVFSAPIPGSSATNTVTFTSATGDSSDVVINVQATAIMLDKVSNLTFKHLTLKGTVGVQFVDSCENIEFSNCDIQVDAIANASYRGISCNGAANPLSDIRILNNRIEGGYYGIYLYGFNSAARNTDVIINNNLINVMNQGIYAYYTNTNQINDNIITQHTNSTSAYYGMNFNTCYAKEIIGNRIKADYNTQYGIYGSTFGAASASRLLIANNEMILNTTTSGSGIYFSSGQNYTDIYHNSILMKGTGQARACLYLQNSATDVKVYNNNFINTAGTPTSSETYAFYTSSLGYLNTTNMDYNNYYTLGVNLMYAGGASADLADWQTVVVNKDMHSVSVLPDLYDYPTTLKLYGFDISAPLLTNVLTDIENTSRATTTTMGCYEFVPSLQLDIQPYAMVAPLIINKGIVETVSITLKNVGIDTITSASIDWKFNNVAQPTVLWTGILLSGETTQITLDTIIPIAGINTFTFISALPNNQPDAYVLNDTLRTSMYACDGMLSGTYTVGSGGDFTTLEDVEYYLMNCGINGPVSFVFNTGTYSTLALRNIIGSSSVNTITFTSASGNASDVTIGSSTQTEKTALTLDGVSNMVFKNITIGLNSTYTGIAVELKRMCENILFYECTIQTYQNGTNTNYCGVKYYNSSGSTNYLKDVRFIKNTVDGGYYNFWLYYTAGNNTNMGASGIAIIIDSNLMTNAYNSGIYNYYYSRYSSISFNTIKSRASATAAYYGIYSQYFTTIDSLIGNKILITSTGTCYGMYFHQYHNHNSVSYGAEGPMFIANNEVIVLGGANAAYGFYDNSGTGYSKFDILHNSFYVSGTGTKYGVYLHPTNASYQTTFLNNNVYVNTSGTANMIHFGTATFNTSAYITVDYNNYYNPTGTASYGNTYTTLAAWQSGSSQDLNSTNTDPGFGTSPVNLIPVTFSTCPLMTAINSDINGDLRMAITYKGCYTAIFDRDAAVTEFVGIGQRSTVGSNPINVRVVNLGRNTLTSVSAQASVDGVLQSQIHLTGLSLAQYSDTVINIGTFVATIGNTTKLKAWTSNPNGTIDQNVVNDTASISTEGCIQVLYGTYDIGGGNNDFATLDSAMFALTNCGVSGPVILRLAPGTYDTLNSISGVYFGTSPTHTVTFTSLTGNANSVIIGAATDIALNLDGAKHLRFTNLTIGNNTTTYGVYFQNTNEDIQFYGCNIISNPTTTSSSYACVYYSNPTSGSTNYLKDIYFVKNNLIGGYYNFFFNYSGSTAAIMSQMSVTIDSNTLQNSYNSGIYSYYYGNFRSISYNNITSRSSGSVTSTWYGIRLDWDNNFNTMVGNKIKSSNTSISSPYGLYFYYYINRIATSNREPLIANNEITLYSGSSNTGIYLYNPNSYPQLLHNSVYMYGTGSANACYVYNTSTSLKPFIANNIFMTAASTTAYPIYYNGTYYDATYLTVDYNNYYSTGLYVGYAGGAVNTLMALQNATRQDANSLNINPGFIAPSVDLHTNGDEMLVDPLSKVLVDINDSLRIPVTNMGCYHDFIPKNVDIKMMAIVSPTASAAVGQSNNVVVKIKNFGLNTIDSVKIHWVVNGVENVYDWQGSLAYNTGSPSISLGSFIPLSGINTLTVFTTQPNGVQDQNTKNDTLSTTVYGCDSLLNGMYTVGGNGDFADEEELMAALLNCGINGAVEFHFASGNYGGLNFKTAINGASTTNTILFTSAAGYPASVNFIATMGPAVTLNNTNHVFFRKVTIDGSASNHGVELQGSCSNIEFYGCNIKADPTTTTSPYSAIYRNGTSGGNATLSNIRIVKNNISGGYYNIYWYYGGSNSSNMGTNCIIDSNVFTDAHYAGIYMNNGYTNFNSISQNHISCRSQNSSSQFYGMYIYYYNNIQYLVGNKIHIRNSAISNAYPMYIYYYNNHTNNSYGPMLIANNEIIAEVGNYCDGGINVYNYTPAEVINNSIYVSATSRAYGLQLYAINATYPIVAKNNNIYTVDAATNYPLYINQAAQIPYITLEHNNYGTNGNHVGFVGMGHTTMLSLRSATQQDTFSESKQPNYLDLNTSLELLDYSDLFCSRYSSVTTDINGALRKMITPMGAYTIDIYDGYNIAVNAIVEPINTSDVFCYQDYASVRLAVQNAGSYLIDFSARPLTMHIEVTGAVNYQSDTILVIGNVPATRKDTFTVTDFLPVSSNGVYNIKVWVSLDADTLYDDDTIQSTYVIDKIILPYSINFDTVPNGLILKQNVGICEWKVVQGNGIDPVIAPSHGSGRLEFNSSIGKGSASTATLQPINLRGTSNPKLEFWYAHDDAPGRDYMDVKISIDGGYSYTSIRNLQRFDAAYTTPTFVHYTVDLRTYASYSCVILSFEAGSYGTGNQNIDSICVTSSEDLSIGLIVPQQDDFVACELDHQQLAVTLTNLTAQDFNFTTKPTQIDVRISGAITKNYSIPLTSGYVRGDSVKRFIVDTNFDFSTNGTYNIMAIIKSVDDNKANDTARSSRIINVDAELVSIDPIADKMVGDTVYVTITVKNNGNIPIHNIPLRLQVNYGSDIVETIFGILDTGDSVVYTFTNPFVVPKVNEAQPYYLLNIKTELACDGISSNNSKSNFYNVILDEFIDLTISSVITPNENVCDTGNTLVYPIVKIKNLGTEIANNITVYISVDSAGTLLKSYSETISFILGEDSIEYTCINAYRVPNFDNNYSFTAFVNTVGDIDLANNTFEVNACAIAQVGVNDRYRESWTLGQNIPNPSTLSTRIPYTVPVDGAIHFKVMTINGQLLYNEEIQASAGTHYLELNTANLSNGIYYYSMEYKGQRIVKKMTVQK